MTSDEFITKLLGEGWTEDMLPTLLSFVVNWSTDAQRYYIVRDAFDIEASKEPKTRQKLALFDKKVDGLSGSL